MIPDKHVGWLRRYEELSSPHQQALRGNWDDLRDVLEGSNRDCLSRKDAREELDDPRWNFPRAFNAFRKVYRPQEAGSAIALYEMDNDLDDFESRIPGLKSNYTKDTYVGADYREEAKELGILDEQYD